MTEIAKIGWSGGKDSTCATYKRLEQGYPEAREKLLELQEILKPKLIGRKNEFPLRGYKYFI